MKLIKFSLPKEITIEFVKEEGPSPLTSWVKDVYYAIMLNHIKVGECDLRIGMNEEIYYAGQVGYRIYFPYRGNGYAYQACLLLFEKAKEEYGMRQLYITCSPENIASDKTLQKLHGKLLALEDVPETHWLYKRGETKKKIYCFSLV